MATQRKSGASRKAAKPPRKTVTRPAPKPSAAASARPAKPAAKAKVVPVKAAAKVVPVKAAAKVVPVKAGSKAVPAKSKPVVATVPPGKAVPGKVAPGKVAPGKAAPGKLAPAAAAAKGKAAKRPVIAVVERKPPAPVRPIGALPPEAVARATHRTSSAAAPIERRAVRPARETTIPSGVEGVSEKDFKDFERRLLDERQKILKEMGHLENTVLKINQRDSAGDLSGYSFHMADVGTDAMEREKAFLFASSEGRLLMEINEALRRVYRGEYGSCENCGKPIARARLEAMPYVRLCVSCKEIEERTARGSQ